MKEYGILNGAKYFADAKSQIYLIFQPIFRCFTTPVDSDRILTWKSKGLSE